MIRIASSIALAAAILATPAAYAEITTYRATMSGPSEAPPNPSPGAGIATIVIDDVALTMHLQVPFFDLMGATTAAHLHCCTPEPLMGTAGVATMTPTFAGFPSGVHAGSYEQTFSLADAATYNASFISNNGGTVDSARAALLEGITSNRSYLNIHTDLYPAGEIRGFLVVVPEPSSWAMLAAGLAGIGFAARKKAQQKAP